MGRQQTVDVARALGVITVFMKKVEDEIRQAGGTDEDIANLAKGESDYAIKKLAQYLLNPDPADCESLDDQYKFAKFDHLYERASDFSAIGESGQVFSRITGAVPRHYFLGGTSSTRALREFGSSSHRLTGLLYTTIKDQTLHFRLGPLATVWFDPEKLDLWTAVVHPMWSNVRNKYLKVLTIRVEHGEGKLEFNANTEWLIL